MTYMSQSDRIAAASLVPVSPQDQELIHLIEENAKLRHTIRKQGEFIISVKKTLSDFLGNA